MQFLARSLRLNSDLLTYWELTQLLIHDPIQLPWHSKTFVHYPNPIKGNKPISIGHSYSVVCALPERIETGNVPWAVPLSGERISAEEKFTDIGNNQLKKIFNSSSFCQEHLSVLVADSLYSQRGFIGEQVKQKNLVTITRVRSNRVYNPSIYSANNCCQKIWTSPLGRR